MVRVTLNSAKNIGTVYHFTNTLDRLSSILESKKIIAGRTTLDKPFVCMGRSAPEIYLKRHIYDWNYGVMLDGSVLSESYSFRPYESYSHGLQDILIVLRKYSDDKGNAFFTVQCGDEQPYSAGMNTAKEIVAFARALEANPRRFYKENLPDRDEPETWIFDKEDEDEYPSLRVDGAKLPLNMGIEITGEFTFDELPKGIQGVLIKSGYEAEERIWLTTRHKKSPYAGKDDLEVADVPFVDIRRAILGVVLPMSERNSDAVKSFLDTYSDYFTKTGKSYISGKWKIRWYND